jgi:hypothetical protein
MTTAPEGRGGYRQPSNPAPVSGPGMLSQRTDGGATEGMTQPQQQYTGFAYGENSALAEQQSGASLAGTGFSDFKFTPLNAPTERPNQPVTAGIDLGEGGGSELMRDLPNYAPSLTDTLKRLAQYDPSGDAELIYRQLLDNGY